MIVRVGEWAHLESSLGTVSEPPKAQQPCGNALSRFARLSRILESTNKSILIPIAIQNSTVPYSPVSIYSRAAAAAAAATSDATAAAIGWNSAAASSGNRERPSLE